MKNQLLYLVTLVVLVLSGCGGDKLHMSGKVTYSDDGSPLTTGMVCFETPSYLARGELKPDGTYIIGSLSEKDGLPAGTYKVYVSGAQKATGEIKGGMTEYEPLIDAKFANSSTSGIEMVVDGKTKSLDFKVDRFKNKK
ncbi:MAG: hypothetical protein ACRCUY_06190 [Thermoguttaceae bacterium]